MCTPFLIIIALFAYSYALYYAKNVPYNFFTVYSLKNHWKIQSNNKRVLYDNVLTNWNFLRVIFLDNFADFLNLGMRDFGTLCDAVQLSGQFAEDILGKQHEGRELTQSIAKGAVRHRLQLLIRHSWISVLIAQTGSRKMLRFHHALHERHLDTSSRTLNHYSPIPAPRIKRNSIHSTHNTKNDR